MEAKEQDEVTAVAVCRVIWQHLDQVQKECPEPTDYEQDLNKGHLL